ncbi:hypothetical protein QFC19_005361 [Naganishia cerealis]|uniref:Uncharacterized protein n=1 Tax=Naganishia cerealis TaxID=610337 RepID=A0ACC2VPZ6_9TREE|nr:hypothetical protein QFC19_005361 [Naganishia cerealis]
MPFEAGPGLLLVFMDLGDKVNEAEFHEWYGEEHVPLRTSTLSTFHTATRFEAIDGKQPQWAAMYTISDNTVFGREEYTKLRANRSPREADLVNRLALLDRRVSSYTMEVYDGSLPRSLQIYKLTSDPSANPSPKSEPPALVIYTAVTPKDSTSKAEFEALLTSAEHRYAKLPGFIRVRRFAPVDTGRTGLSVPQGEKKDIGAVLEVAEFSNGSITDEEAYQALTAWYDEALEPMVSYIERRPFKLYKDYEPTAALKQ